jgi:hypothetical protein
MRKLMNIVIKYTDRWVHHFLLLELV